MAKGMEVEQDLPGFRFHPTEEELLGFYLSRVVHGKKLQFDIIGTLNIYRHDPWELPGMAKIGEREWYFFVPRDRKGGSGGRPNRTTERGFWKATGSDRAIRSTFDPKRIIGLKKTLVFYRGRAPRGTKTDWVMNEYRLPDPCLAAAAAAAAAVTTLPKEDMVLCKIYRKATSLRELEQRAAMEEAQKASLEGDTRASPALCASLGEDYLSSDDQEHLPGSSSSIQPNMIKMAKSDGIKKETEVTTSNSSRQATALPELQVPNQSLEWMQDPFLTQLRSPWQDQHCWSPCTNLLYF